METKISNVTIERDAMPEGRIWKAVIVSTIQEWISGPLRRQREAEQYLFSDSSDFRLVCEAAGMDVGTLRARLTKYRKQSEIASACQIAA